MRNQYNENWRHAHKHAAEAGLEIIEHGWEQHVIIDEAKGMVYRYPRHEAAAAKLSDEVAVLRKIHEQTWSIALPVLREHNEVFTSYAYIPGEVLNHRQLHGMNETEIIRIGHALGYFLAQLHRLAPETVEQKSTKHDISLLEYYRQRIESGGRYSQPARATLGQLTASELQPKPVVTHGDLHGLNIVINGRSKALAGVIDLSEMETGDPHQEFRKLFMTHELLLRAALESYQENDGEILDTERIKAWAYVNEWANVCYFENEPEHPTYQRATAHLRRWGQM